MVKQDFLFEIGCEELPPKSLKILSEFLATNMVQQLKKAGLSFGNYKIFATPRRLSLLIKDLDIEQKSNVLERKGPAVQSAFDEEGNPTSAALGFARSCNIDVKTLKVRETPKGAWLTHQLTEQGKLTKTLIPHMIEKTLHQLPISKRMRWGSNRAEFVRPVHWLILMLGSEVIPCQLFGCQSDNITYGHRFHSPQPIEIIHPEDYETLLQKNGFVIASFKTRQQKIREQIEVEVQKIGGTAAIEPELLEEVTALTEWPVALIGRFEDTFLSVPHEALISSMKKHQKYFHVLDKQQKLLPFFVTISNIESKNPSAIIRGNEKVIRPRLYDAKFFYECDKNSTLEQSRTEKLPHVIFQKQLGSLFNKTERLATIAQFIAQKEGGNTDNAFLAGQLCKSDLVSDMVFEFPELQGIMGKYYAQNDNINDDVCLSLEEHYKPKFSNDSIPSTLTGCTVAIADKLDTIVGIFGINQIPTGNKDPFALRRSALGILRIIYEQELNLNLKELIRQSINIYNQQKIEFNNPTLTENIFEFFCDRLKARYLEQGISTEVFNAVYALRPEQPTDFNLRIKAVQKFITLPESDALAAANKRVSNILSKEEYIDIPNFFDKKLLREPAEIKLSESIEKYKKAIEPLKTKQQYVFIMETLSKLKIDVDRFFNEVLVQDKDLKIRVNRFALLKQLRTLFLNVADISLLQKS